MEQNQNQNKQRASARNPGKTERIRKIKAAGIVFIVLALLANPYVIGWLLATSKRITQPSLMAAIIIIEAVLLFTGAYLYRKPENYKNIIVLWLTCLILWLPADFLMTKAAKLSAPQVDTYRQPDKILDHSLIPGGAGVFITPEFNTTYKINSDGLRNPEIGEKKKIRILMLGDSFTEGHGVNYADSIPKKLNDYLGDKYEVINGGVSSYSPVPEYLYLKTKGMKLKPDIVILNFDNSDLQNDMEYTEHGKYDRKGELVSIGQYIFLKASFSNTYSLINRLFYRHSDSTAYLEYHTKLDNCSQFEKEWNVSFKYLNKTKHYLEDRNVSFYVTIYPYGHQVATNQWVEGRKLFNFESDKVYPFAFADCFRNHTYGENFTVFNVLRDFRDAAADKKLYYRIDGHMTAEGYDLMAKGIYERLVSVYASKG